MPEPARSQDRDAVRRLRRMRVLGLGLGVPAIGAVLWQHGAGWLPWLLLLLNGLAWPHLAWWHASRQPDPRRVERAHRLLDSASGGAWIAVMHFDLVPSALVASLMLVDKVGVGGWPTLARCAAAMAVTCVLVSAALGFPFEPRTGMITMLWCLPLLFGYPLAVSTALYNATRRARQQNRLLERLNRIDVLTGLPNRRHWNEGVSAEFARHLRTRRPAVMMLIDVDHFKDVNDRFGHAVGDEVLRTLAAVMRGCVREIDLPARHGGDEFGLLLAETDLRGGREVAERIRVAFRQLRGLQAEAVACTLSIGLAEADRAFGSADDWVERADGAMYRAKKGGGDRVEADRGGGRARARP